MEQQRKKQKFSYKNHNFNKKKFIEPGQCGFLATCNFREKDCVRESYNILNQYADELYGPPPLDTPAAPIDTKPVEENDTKDDDDLDIADALQQQIDASKQQKNGAPGKTPVKHRFQAVDTGANNCVFITCTNPISPVELCKRIVEDIKSTQKQKSRFLLRLVPIEVVCRANLTDILNAAGLLFDKHFLKEPATYSIIYNKRYNNAISRDNIIAELANLVASKNIGNRVDLKNAQKSIVVEIIKGICCMSVIEGYLQHKKYNLIELANGKAAGQADKESIEEEDKESKPDEESKSQEEVEAAVSKPQEVIAAVTAKDD